MLILYMQSSGIQWLATEKPNCLLTAHSLCKGTLKREQQKQCILTNGRLYATEVNTITRHNRNNIILHCVSKNRTPETFYYNFAKIA